MDRTKMAAKVLGSMLIGMAALTVTGQAAADTEIHSSNSCEDCKNESGDAYATNTATTSSGQNAGNGGSNFQDGDNETEVDQDASAESGAASSGQIIGVAGGDGDVTIYADNHNENVKNTTGNVFAGNQLVVFTGQSALNGGLNTQLGDNETDVTQSSDATSGDAISGGVIGVV